MFKPHRAILFFAASIGIIGCLTSCSDQVIIDSSFNQTNELEASIFENQYQANLLNDAILNEIAPSSRGATDDERTYPSYYGGSYIELNGDLTIFVVGDSLSAVTMLNKISASPLLKYKVAKFSYEELCNVNDEIQSYIDKGPREVAKNVSAYGINTEFNAVQVYLIDNSDNKIEEFRSVYDHPCLMFSQLGRVVTEAKDICPGDKVCRTISTEDKYGSIAFRAQELAGDKRVGFVTAGHVLATDQVAYIDYIKMGVCVKSVNDGGGKADAAFVVIDSSQSENFRLQNYINGNQSTPLNVLMGSSPGNGTYVNKWGAQTGRTGGNIVNNLVHIVDKAGNVIMKDMATAQYASDGGDSGGIVYTFIASTNTRYLVGVHKGSDKESGLAFYSKGNNVLSALDLKMY